MLEVTAFMVWGYAGLKGTTDFKGLDQVRQSMPTGVRHGDERFFYQDAQGGAYVVKKEILAFIMNLGKGFARSEDSDTESEAFLNKILGLINRMLKPVVTDRVDISRVVETLKSALDQATASAIEHKLHQVVPAEDEVDLGIPLRLKTFVWLSSALATEVHLGRNTSKRRRAGTTLVTRSMRGSV